MTITLNHTIVPARDKVAAAKFFAQIFGLKRVRTGHFAPVPVTRTLLCYSMTTPTSKAIISPSMSAIASSTPYLAG